MKSGVRSSGTTSDSEPGINIAVNLIETDGCVVMTMSGELDHRTLPEVRWSRDEAIASSKPLVLDLSGVTYIGSAGLMFLLDTLKRTDDLRLIGSTRVLRIIDVSGVRALLTLYSSVADATAAPSQKT
jgi:anti-sigma B factor antagonist